MPYVRGCLYASSHENDGPVMTAGSEDTSAEYLHEAPDRNWTSSENVENNEVKALRTKSGHTIEIHDKGPKGMFNHEGYIRIYNAHKPHYEILLSSDRNLIKLRSEGNIELKAANNIIMKAGNDIKMEAGHDYYLYTENDLTMESNHIYTASSVDDMWMKTNKILTTQSDEDTYIVTKKDRHDHVDGKFQTETGKDYIVKSSENAGLQVTKKFAVKAQDIEMHAQSSFKEYSMTHEINANQSANVTATGTIDIKAQIIREG